MKGSPDLRLNLPRKSALEINIHYRLLGGRHSSHIAETTVVALTLGWQVSTYRQINEKKNPFSNFALQEKFKVNTIYFKIFVSLSQPKYELQLIVVGFDLRFPVQNLFHIVNSVIQLIKSILYCGVTHTDILLVFLIFDHIKFCM